MYPHIHSSIHNSQKVKATQVSTDRWINKMWCMNTMEYFSALKMKEILIHATRWMNLEDMLRNKQSHKDKYSDSVHKEVQVSRTVKFIETEIMVVAGAGGKGERELLFSKFSLFCKIKSVLEMNMVVTTAQHECT